MRPYRKENIPRAKELRHSMTPWERKLWYGYLNRCPVRFQRQKAIGPYIVDFYCAEARLVLELDDGGHYEPAQAARDERRSQVLEGMGLRILRICNSDVEQNFSGVCQAISQAVAGSLPQSAAPTAPSSEGAPGDAAT